MSSSGSLPIIDSAFGSGHHKNPKKKRHRKKVRNTNLRNRRAKKFHCVKKTNSLKSNTYKCNIDGEKIMSNWYWSNYKKAVEWQERHKIAHWKACALALLEENRYLLQIINDMQSGFVPDVSVTQSNLGEGPSFNTKGLKGSPGYFTNFHIHRSRACDEDEDDGNEDEDNSTHADFEDDNVVDDGEDEDIEFEMSEEMIQFFEQSYRHKMDMKKLKEKELLNKAEEEIKQMQNNKIKRSTEMNLLYGDGASMIIGMETAVQLSFDKYCDTKSPKYWPNIPFRL